MNITSYSGFTRREVGILPVSIGTSLAIEGLQSHNIPKYDNLWINVRTIYRNLIASVDTATRDSASPDDVAAAMLDDIQHVNEGVFTITQGRVVPVYYLSAPETLANVLPEAIVRSPQTPLQKATAELSEAAIRIVVKELGDKNVLRFRPILSGTGVTLLLTHFPTDLLGRKNFAELMLLESHTGKIKRYAEFNSKLTSGNSLAQLPFNGFILTMFGDNNVLLKQAPPKIRAMVLELADKYRWTPVTTRDKIKYSIDSVRDAFSKQFLQKVLSKTKY